ncbi:TRAFs-binding domain-containing protein [Planctobacterium marinum]|uniref:MAP3K TRAFs-binding domain-containing protein n=1 Tax=Planctobacterium marinum TaxID=1631968 RepID=A0AA48KTX6_9ALTE|nr:hypothetical protein MACH26_13910 [Planctobacterium marinum]
MVTTLLILHSENDTEQATQLSAMLECKLQNAVVITELMSDSNDIQIKHADDLILLNQNLTPALARLVGERQKLPGTSTLSITGNSATSLSSSANESSFEVNESNLINWFVQSDNSNSRYDVDRLIGKWDLDLLSHLKTDIFIRDTNRTNPLAEPLRAAVAENDNAKVQSIFQSVSDINQLKLEDILDLYLSLRAFKLYEEMQLMYESLHPVLQNKDLFKEQYVFASNRLSNSARAKAALIKHLESIASPTAETKALGGRIYKDCWHLASKNKSASSAKQYLNLAIDWYQAACQLDTRDMYPAINLATLLKCRNAPGDIALMRDVLDNIRYNLRMSTTVFDQPQADSSLKRQADYWDYATVFEMYVLREHADNVSTFKAKLFSLATEQWMLATTLNNLTLIDDYSSRSSVFLTSLIEEFQQDIDAKFAQS